VSHTSPQALWNRNRQADAETCEDIIRRFKLRTLVERDLAMAREKAAGLLKEGLLSQLARQHDVVAKLEAKIGSAGADVKQVSVWKAECKREQVQDELKRVR
jgi:hypothetical protein